MQRKLSTSFAVTLEQLQRLEAVAEKFRINRSQIVRNALERELAIYEKQKPAKVVGGRGGVEDAVVMKTARRA